MKRLIFAVVCLTGCSHVPGTAGNPVMDAVRFRLDQASTNTIGAAQLMPAEKYSFHPTPAQMTFAELMAHIVGTNYTFCSGISGTKSPLTTADLHGITGHDAKEKLVGAIKGSFAYCSTALASTKDEPLSDQMVFFGLNSGQTRGFAMITLAADWADHYSTAASYLRLNDIIPPSAK